MRFSNLREKSIFTTILIKVRRVNAVHQGFLRFDKNLGFSGESSICFEFRPSICSDILAKVIVGAK